MAAAGFPAMKRPLVAILRGIQPNEARDVVMALVDAGFEAVEIPLNSPDAFASIEIAAKAAGKHCLIGAGTVLTPQEADRLDAVGGRLLVSPNVDAEVIAAGARHGMVILPGVFTPTEALAAVKAGASGLKFFPASVLGPAGINAIRAVLPKDCVTAAVGGVSEKNFAEYMHNGISVFGLGSSLYKPGASATETGVKAQAAIKAYDSAASRL